MALKCECSENASLKSTYAFLYDPVRELPYVTHAPNECKCTNNLQLYKVGNKYKWLCSNCCTSETILESELDDLT